MTGTAGGDRGPWGRLTRAGLVGLATAYGRRSPALRDRRRRLHLRRPALRRLGVLIAGLAVLQVLFFGLLVAGAAVPDKPIVGHLLADIRAGTYGPAFRPDNMGGTSDSFTECVVAGTGLGEPGLSPWRRALVMPRISNCQLGAEQLHTLGQGQPAAGVGEYFRYWAGYTPLTRPLLALWGMDGLRLVVGTLLVVCAAAAAVALARRTTTAYAVALGLPLVLASNLLSTPTVSFSQALSMAVAFLGVLLAVKGAQVGLWAAAAGVMAGAALFNYVDLLTTPAIPWALSAAAVGAVVHCRTASLRRTVHGVLAAAVAWPVAYGITWASRWAIALVFLGRAHTESSIRSTIEFRLNGAYTTVHNSFGAATGRNVGYWLTTVPTAKAVLAAAALVIVASLVLAWRRFGRQRLVLAAVLSAPALIVPLWYEVLRNHSQIHAFFVYRDVPVALGVVLAATVLAAFLPARTQPSPRS